MGISKILGILLIFVIIAIVTAFSFNSISENQTGVINRTKQIERY